MPKLRLTYSSYLNISFRDVIEWEEDEGEEVDDEYLKTVAVDWLFENVDVHVEVVEE